MVDTAILSASDLQTAGGALRPRGPLRLVALGDSNGQYAPGWVRTTARLAGGKIRIVNNACIAGETSAQIASRFGRDVEPFTPDLVMIQIGTNDSANSAAIVPMQRALIKQARSLRSDPYVFVCATVPHYQYISAGLTTKNDLQTLVSTEFASDPKVIFVDTYTALLDPSTPSTVPNTYFGDVHFTRRGAWKFGEAVLATPAVAAILANVYSPVQASANDGTRQIIANPNFDTGAETSGRAASYSSSSSGTAMVMSTGTDAAITGKYQRLTIPAGNTYAQFQAAASTVVAATYGGRRIWSSFKMRVVSRPSDASLSPSLGSILGVTKDTGAYVFGDAQSGLSTSSSGPSLVDLEDGVWYYFYSETVADEVFAAVANILTMTGNGSAATALVVDFAEMNWGLLETQNTVNQGLNASYSDTSGSPGAATINKSAGRAAIAAAASSVVITNSKVLATSVVMVSLEDGDTTATSIRVSAVSAGSFTVTANAAATAATKFRFAVIN